MALRCGPVTCTARRLPVRPGRPVCTGTLSAYSVIPAAAGEFSRSRSPSFKRQHGLDRQRDRGDLGAHHHLDDADGLAHGRRRPPRSAPPLTSSRPPNWSATGAIDRPRDQQRQRRGQAAQARLHHDRQRRLGHRDHLRGLHVLVDRLELERQPGDVGPDQRQLRQQPLEEVAAERLVDVGHAAVLDAALDRPAEQQLDRAQQQRALGREQHPRADRLDLEDRRGRVRRAPRRARWPTSAATRSAPRTPAAPAARRDRRVDAVRQNASSVRPRRRSCSEVNLVGRVKSTARMRRRRCGAGFSSGRRPSRAASTSAAIASSLRTGPPALTPRTPAAADERAPRRPPASRTVTRLRADVDADRAPAIPAGLGGDHVDPLPRRAGRAQRPRCADRPRAWSGTQRTCSHPRPGRPPASPRRPPSVDDAVDELGNGEIGELPRARGRVAAAGGQHDVGQPGHADPPIQQRQADARAQAEGHEYITGDGRGGELAHPDHRLRHRPRGPGAPASARRRPASGTSRNDTEQSSRSTTRSESSSSATSPAPARSASTVSTIAPSMSVAAAGGVGSSASPVISASALM